MTSPQPMEMRRRSGAKRGDHGPFIAPIDPVSSVPSELSESIGTDQARPDPTPETASAPVVSRRGRVAQPVSDAAAAAKAAYDAKPKVIFRGVDEETYYKLRAIYKHQLRSEDGVEGWSEFGRAVILQQFVAAYEEKHGAMTGGEAVELP